jgi:hypothetical protein
MATTIVTKYGSDAPTASDIVRGELAVDTENGRLYTENSSADVVELGSNPSGNITFGDNGKAIFGAGSDLQIYHNGGDSLIADTGTGDLYIRGSNNIFLQKGDGSETFISTADDGAVTLHYDNAAKLATTSTGISVTGNIANASGDMTLDVAGEIILDADTQGSGNGVLLKDDGTHYGSFFRSSSNFHIKAEASDQDMIFMGNDGGSEITALTLDMSAAGAATFNAGATIKTTSNEEDALLIKQSDGTDVGSLRINNGSFLLKGKSASQPVQIQSHDGNEDIEIDPDGFIKFETAGSERLRIDASGKVGIGLTNPSAFIHVTGSESSQYSGSFNNTSSQGWGLLVKGGADGDDYSLRVQNKDAADLLVVKSNGNVGIGVGNSKEAMIQSTNSGRVASNPAYSFKGDLDTGMFNPQTDNTVAFATGGTEAARFDSSQNFLVGQTTNAETGTGIGFVPDGTSHMYSASTDALMLGRGGSDGDILSFNKSGTAVGSIGVQIGNRFVIHGSSGSTGAGWYFGSQVLLPLNHTGTLADNVIDLGQSSYRFDDIYATNGTIQTSDRNEKQDIAELSEAEQRVAVAAKGLLRKFRWKSSVAEKGDEARTHFGIIAQDLQAAFAAEGLDAGDYAMFISTTWTDEETNEERTRMGVRYSELLAFIISAI